jgi:ribosome-associated translation inhibitor RaiA
LKFYERIVSVRAVLERETTSHRVELVATVGHRATLVVDARAELLEAALDAAIARMATVLKRHKARLADKHRRGPAHRRDASGGRR